MIIRYLDPYGNGFRLRRFRIFGVYALVVQLLGVLRPAPFPAGGPCMLLLPR